MMKRICLCVMCQSFILVILWFNLGMQLLLRQSTHVERLSKAQEIPFVYFHSIPFSKDLVVHSAYFDDRPRNGHTNITMFFVDINKTIFDFKWVTGCGVGDRKAENFLLRYVAEDLLLHKWLGPCPFLYENAVVECYDLPVVNGSRGFVIYKTENDSAEHFISESESPVMIPTQRIEPAGEYNFTVLTCAKAHNRNVTWLPEFVRYQRTLGVDHVHINILDTFIKDGGLHHYMTSYPALRQDVKNGYLTFSLWKEWYNDRGEEKEVYLHSEILRKLDCLYRYRGTYDYAFSLDTDDFFTPCIPGVTNVKEYILRYCYVEPAASCAFNWLYYYPDVCGIEGEIGADGNVTNHLKSYRRFDKTHHFKSVHRTQVLLDATFHDAKVIDGCLLPGYEAVVVPPSDAYMAHLRMHENITQEKAC